ncbi:MAG: hypothetical protein M3463_16525 [Verrucomicrobiota bacterium]|nr:hypothetical protein [Verrucomicrobiota bacterium]
MRAIAENLWVLRFPLRLFGTKIGRTVTLIRLRNGELVIHSTAPFTWADVSLIAGLGKPGWLVDATRLHGTFARQGHAAFPTLPYLAPEGFSRIAGVRTGSLGAPPAAWSGELDVLRLEGMPKVQEHVFFHRPSRTLVAADLIFNFGPDTSAWTRTFMRCVAGLKCYPGMSRFFRMTIRDRRAFGQSVRTMMEWDFDRVIVAHGEIIEKDGKRRVAEALAARGF